MKIAFLCNNMKSLNGVERVLSQRLSLLAESGLYDVYLITCNQYGAPLSFPISNKVHHIDLATRFLLRCSYHGVFQYIDRYFSKIGYIRVIRKCLESISPDVITCVDMHVADLEAVLSVKTSAIKVVECHSGRSAYFSDLKKENSSYKYMFGHRQKRELVRVIEQFDKIVVMTEAEKQDWNMDGKVVHIPNMLPDYPQLPKTLSSYHRQVISVGRYAYQKGFDMLLDAWRIVQDKHPDWALHVYGSHDGDSGDYNMLQIKIASSHIHNAFLHQASSDVFSRYMESDFYVMSSRFESFGLVLIEAMSCGLPVVSFDCKYGPVAIVKDGVTGKLVPQNDVVQLADAICSMIENKEECLRMAHNARTESAKYKSDSIMPLWHEFYKSLVTDRPRVS